MTGKMFRSLVLMSILFVFIVSCQEEEDTTSSEVIATSVATEDLPTSAQEYVEINFTGEVVTSTYVINGTNTLYEAFLTDGMNLIFDASGDLEAFGEDVSFVDCEGVPQRSWGRRRGPKKHFFGGDSTDRPDYTELTTEELPSVITDYLDTNYAENVILLILLIERDEDAEYHVLIEDVGAVIFDADGNFVEVNEGRGCGNFGRLEIEDLPEAVTDYVIANYPDNEILRARTGMRNEVEEIHVLVDEVGVLIFDEDGNFIELKTCGMDRV